MQLAILYAVVVLLIIIFNCLTGSSNTIFGNYNTIVCNGNGSFIVGNSNCIGRGSCGNILFGGLNTVFQYVYNSVAFGSQITVSKSSTLYANNICVTGGLFSAGVSTDNVSICQTGAGGYIDFDLLPSSTYYYTNNSESDFTLNLRGLIYCSMNNLLQVGKSLNATFLNTNGSTAYSLTGIYIDGNLQTVKWLNTTGYPAGNAESVDSYSITTIKTGENLYSVLACHNKFA
jgi:hypothetical protein